MQLVSIAKLQAKKTRLGVQPGQICSTNFAQPILQNI